MIPFRARKAVGDATSTLSFRGIAIGTVLVVVFGLIASGKISIAIEIGDHDRRTMAVGQSADTAAASTPAAGVPAAGADATASTAPAGASAVPVTTGGAPTTTRSAAAPQPPGVGGEGAQAGPVDASPDPAADPTADQPAAPDQTAAPAPDQPAGPDPEQPATEAPDACNSGPLSATDQGVTESTIKLGFATVSAVTEDHKRVLEKIPSAWVAELNALGGICGRQVEYVLEHTTYSDAAAQTATCRKLALDDKVFAVIGFASFNTDAGQMCLAKDNKIPLMSWDALPDSYYQEAGNYLWLARLSETRMLRNWVRAMREFGYVDPATNRVGLIYEGTPYDSLAVEGDMLPEMERQGITPVRVFKTSPSILESINQMPNAVLEMRSAQVDYIFWVASVFHKQQFLQHAEQQGYFPRYTDSDIKDGCADLLHKYGIRYPSKSFDRTICVTAHFSGITPENKTQGAQYGEWVATPFAQYADEVYNRFNEGGYEADRGTQQEEDLGYGPGTTRMLHYIVGSHVMIWADAAERVGRDLTREAWAEEMGTTGKTERTAFSPHLNYLTGKPDGPDLIAVTQFFAEAANGYEPRSFQQIVPFFPAYY